MSILNSKIIRIIFILLFISMLLICYIFSGCEAENPGEPAVNLPPDTYISEASAGNTTTISFYGTDKDGFVDKFAYQWQEDVSWTETGEQTISFQDLFSSEDEIKIFYVKGIDNNELEDPTAAEVALTPTNALPETEITAGPTFGSAAGEDVTFTFKGKDADHEGSITIFEYTLDDLDNWHETPVERPEAMYLGLSIGAHVFYVRAVDNLGGKDPTPAQVAFLVENGKFTPEIIMTSDISNGTWLFARGSIKFSWNAVTAHYYGNLPEAPFSAAIDDSANYNTNPLTPLASGWNSDSYLVYAPSEGSHTFYLKVRDTAGGIALKRIQFNVALASFDKGVLVVNGVDPDVYGTEINDRIEQSAFWGSVSVNFWDIFGSVGQPHPNISLPGDVTYVGGGTITATVLGQYSTLVWLGNSYGGDFDVWNMNPIFAYLKAGGNIVLATRSAANFLPEALTNYLNIGWREESSPGSTNGKTILECKSVFPGIVDMEFDITFGLPSGSAIFSAGGFLDSEDDNTVTAWDSISGYTKSDLNTTLLFAHRSASYDTLYPFSFVRGLGVWSHPNFSFTSTFSGDEFPMPGTEEAQGNFILFSARNYRFDIEATKSNFEFILRNMCGEQ
jgi:hypothetical protein